MKRFPDIAPAYSSAGSLCGFLRGGYKERSSLWAVFSAFLLSIFFLNFGGTCTVAQNPAEIPPQYRHIGFKDLPTIGITNLNPDDLTIAVATGPADYVYTLSFGSGVDKRGVNGDIVKEDFISQDYLDSPMDLAIDENGYIYIADYLDEGDFRQHGKIRVFDPEGNPLKIIPIGFYRPIGIDVDSQNIYIAEYYDGQQGPEQGSEFSRISVYNKETGNLVKKNEDDVEVPYRIAVDSRGTIYVSQAGDGNSAVLIFDENLNYEQQLPNVQSPGSLVVDKFDYLHVVEYAGKIDFGQFLDFSNIGFNEAIDFTHKIFDGIEENAFGVKIFDSNHSLKDYFKKEVDFPIDIAFNDCDQMYLLNSVVKEIYHYDNFLVHEFLPSALETDLEIYERTPTFDSVEAPEIICPEDITVTAQPGDDFAEVEFDDAEATDNCVATVEQTEGLPSGSEFSVGSHTIEFTATDDYGLTASCTLTIIVNPSEEVAITKPAFQDCPSELKITTDEGKCGAIVNYIKPTAFDENGSVAVQLVEGYASGEEFPVGTTEVVFAATNAAGTSTCSITVTVIDNEDPVFVECLGDEIQVGVKENGQYILPDYSTEVSVKDNCSEKFTFVQDPPKGTVLTTGRYIHLFAYDEAGNESSSCSFELVLKEEEPTLDIACIEDQTIYLDAGGAMNLKPEDFFEGDPGDLLLSLNQYYIDCSNIGVLDLTLTAEDPETGAKDSCTLELTILDELPPTIICPPEPLSRTFPEGGAYEVPDFFEVYGVFDNCAKESEMELYQDIPAGTMLDDAGSYTVTLTAVDQYNNSSTCTIILELSGEQTIPEIECKTTNLYLDNSGKATLDPKDIFNGDANADNISNMEAVPQSFSCEDLGSKRVELTVYFTDGSSQKCTTNITILDGIDPSIDCPQDQSRDFNPETGFVIPDFTRSVSGTDNCTVKEIIQSPIEGTTVYQDTQINLTVKDETGNTRECRFMLILSEETENPPAPKCRDSQVILDSFFDGRVEAEWFYDGDPEEDGVTLELNRYEITCEDLGETELTLTITDDSGASTTCIVTATVIDGQKPVFDCPSNMLAGLPESEGYKVPDFSESNPATDNCPDGLSYQQIPAPGTIIQQEGIYEITLTATDAAGNSTDCTFPLTLEAIAPLEIFCPADQTVDLEGNCDFTIPDYRDLATVNPDATISQDPAPGTVVTANTTVRLSASLDGVSDFCEFEVILTGQPELNIVCPGDITAYANSEGNFRLPDYTKEGGVTGDCSTITVTQIPEAGTVIDEDTTITLTVTNVEGTTHNCEFKVNLTQEEPEPGEGSCPEGQPDTTAPVANCVSTFTLYLNEEGYGILSPEIIDRGSTDNCGIDRMLLSQTRFTTADLGTKEVTLTIFDAAGNRASCTTTVTVAPYNPAGGVNCIDAITLRLSEAGNYNLKLYYSGDPENEEIEISKTEFSCADIGTTQTITATYWGEYTGSCEIEVTVIDDLPPVINCVSSFDVRLNAAGRASISADDLLVSAEDNCEVGNISLSQSDFTTAQVGTQQQVILTVTDASGNSSSCTVAVNILPSEEEAYVILYPNPNNGYFYIETSIAIDLDKANIFDMRGRFLFTVNFSEEAVPRRIYPLDLRHLASGVYTVELISKEEKFLRRAIIKSE